MTIFMTSTITIHFQKYPFPGASFGIEQLIRGYTNETIKVVLLGNSAGFEEQISQLFRLNFNIEDRSVQSEQIINKLIYT